MMCPIILLIYRCKTEQPSGQVKVPTYHVRQILITKGDLLDQEKKIKSSKLSKYFNYIEIVSQKNEITYMKILEKYNVKPKNFLMVGNSLKSDVLPVTNIGGMSFYIPFELTWELEKVEDEKMSTNYVQLENISEIPTRLKSLEI